MFPLILAAAAMGALNAQQKNQQEQSDREVQGATTRFSPWTHLVGQAPQHAPSVLGGAIGGGIGGYMADRSLPDGGGGGGTSSGGLGNVGAPKLTDSSWNMLGDMSGPGTGTPNSSFVTNETAPSWMAFGGSQQKKQPGFGGQYAMNLPRSQFGY